MTIDERLEALTINVEVMSGMLKDMLARDKRRAEEIRHAEDRERRGRQAILTGIAAYLRAFEDDGENPNGG